MAEEPLKSRSEPRVGRLARSGARRRRRWAGSDFGFRLAEAGAARRSARISLMPWAMQVRNNAGSVIAAASVLIPMQQVPASEIRVIMAAQPGSGPDGYIRVILAPAR